MSKSRCVAGQVAGFLGRALTAKNVVAMGKAPEPGDDLTVDFRKFINRIRVLIPRPVLPTVEKVVRDVHQVLTAFLLGQFLVAVALGVMYTVGLLIVQAPLALVIGPLAGFLALVPYLGFVVGFGSAALLTFLEYQDLWHLVGVTATFVIAQTIEGWVLTPKLLGKKKVSLCKKGYMRVLRGRPWKHRPRSAI